MRLLRAAWPVGLLSCSVALVTSACGDSGGSGVNGGTGASNGSGANGSGASKASGANGTGANGPDLGNLGGESDGTGVMNPTDTCAGDLIEAKRIPLDMYIMLDISGSMLEPTEGNATLTKWQAVSAALSDFVSDPASAGIGVGLQVFPIADAAAPTECTTNQQCGKFGPCFLKTCWGYEDGLVPCQANSECGLYGPCVTFGVCANDDTYVCNSIGKTCGAGLGNCIAPPPSICLLTADCRPATYQNPASPIAELPGAEAELLAVIAAAMPDGLTPTGPALTGAIAQASAWAEAHPDHQVVAVLATDGLPTLEQNNMDCREITAQSATAAEARVAAVAADGLAAKPSVSTFVIGVFGSGEIGGPETLHAIAQSGGSDEAFIVDTKGNVAAQFRDALNQIRASRLSCELLVPEADAGKTVDFNQVNVEFDDGSGPADLFYVEDASGCDAQVGGWYYDKLPSEGAPERIIVCPSTCTDFGKIDMGSVQIKLGCATRTPVK